MDCFVSDLHLSHNNVIKYCGRTDFMTYDEKSLYDELMQNPNGNLDSLKISNKSTNLMDATIIDNLNNVAGHNGRIFCLGDIWLGKNFDNFIALRKRIKSKNLYLVLGNHDKLIRKYYEKYHLLPLHSNGFGQEQAYETYHNWHKSPLIDIFKFVGDYLNIKIAHEQFCMSHYLHANHEKQRYGSIMLYGHSHGEIEEWRSQVFPNGRMLDVGIDYRNSLGKGYTPWTLGEILNYFNDKKKV